MTWAHCAKTIPVTDIQGYLCTHPLAKGRAPAITKVDFTPLELFAATARCSHLHHIDPTLVTPERTMVQTLVQEYVDDISPDFFILSKAENFKDYVKGYFVGSVATGLAYLAMERDGYVWAGHFENLGGGNPNVARKPDFAFADPDGNYALMESKGSRTYSPSRFDNMVADGYLGQVQPHLGYPVGGVIATHGYSIGSYLKSTSQAELRIHHTVTPGAVASAGTSSSLGAIQRENYATVLTLVHSASLGEQIRRGDTPEAIEFLQFQWRGRTWWTAANGGGPNGINYVFAIESNIARTALDRFLRPDASEDSLDIVPLEPERFRRERDPVGDPDGSMFADGFAIVARPDRGSEIRQVRWLPPEWYQSDDNERFIRGLIERNRPSLRNDRDDQAPLTENS